VQNLITLREEKTLSKMQKSTAQYWQQTMQRKCEQTAVTHHHRAKQPTFLWLDNEYRSRLNRVQTSGNMLFFGIKPVEKSSKKLAPNLI